MTPIVHRRHVWASPKAKADHLQELAAGDSREPEVRAVAAKIWADAERKAKLAAGRGVMPQNGAVEWWAIRDIYELTTNAVRYVSDTGGEVWAHTMEVLRSRADDCDGKARAFVALVKALPKRTPRRVLTDAWVVPHFDAAGQFVHVSAAARIGMSDPIEVELTVPGLPFGAKPPRGWRSGQPWAPGLSR